MRMRGGLQVSARYSSSPGLLYSPITHPPSLPILASCLHFSAFMEVRELSECYWVLCHQKGPQASRENCCSLGIFKAKFCIVQVTYNCIGQWGWVCESGNRGCGSVSFTLLFFSWIFLNHSLINLFIGALTILKKIYPWTHYPSGLYKYCLIHITLHLQIETRVKVKCFYMWLWFIESVQLALWGGWSGVWI